MKAPELVVKKFYDSLNEGKLLATKCKDCGSVEFPPLYSCNACTGHNVEWTEVSGDAVVIELLIPMVMLRAPEDEDLWPYALGAVKLKEGPEIRTLIRGVTTENEAKIRGQLGQYPCKAELVQRDGYKRVIFRVEE